MFKALSVITLLCIFFVINTRKNPNDTEITHVVELEISIDGKEEPEKISIGLFGNDVPRTAENFIHLALGDIKNAKGKVLTYKGSRIHRIIPGSLIHAGDIIHGSG